jgi:hypothetical protein
MPAGSGVAARLAAPADRARKCRRETGAFELTFEFMGKCLLENTATIRAMIVPQDHGNAILRRLNAHVIVYAISILLCC